MTFSKILQILESKGETNAAIPVLQKGATLDPESKAIQQVSVLKIGSKPNSS